MLMNRLLLTALLALLACGNAWADRVKDLASVAAGRSNQLIGFGLVVGLQGTGDGSDVSFTTQSMKAILGRLGISVDVPLSDFSLLSGAEKDAKVGKIDVKTPRLCWSPPSCPALPNPVKKSMSTSPPLAKPAACVAAV